MSVLVGADGKDYPATKVLGKKVFPAKASGALPLSSDVDCAVLHITRASEVKVSIPDSGDRGVD
jgi:hypothetical protein